jgi:hypothetical protein
MAFWRNLIHGKEKKMTKKILVLFALLAVLMFTPSVMHAQQTVVGTENFVFVNYIGHELNLDLDDVQYTVPGTDVVPEGGRLSLTLPYGEHKFAANVPGSGGAAGEFSVTPGAVVGKAVRFEKTAPEVKDGILIEKPKDYVFIFDFDPNAPVAVAEPVMVDTWQPEMAAAGQGSLVWINYNGDELTVDLNGELYKVPPTAATGPGRLQINVAPGKYAYTASIPYGSLNDEVILAAGEVRGISISAELPEEPDYDVGDYVDLTPDITLRQSSEDLTVNAATAALPAAVDDGSPQVLPVTGIAPSPVVLSPPVVGDNLKIKNYAGDTLIFTIDGQTYNILRDEALTLALKPGQYSYTASTPFVATTGVIDIVNVPSQPVELSVVINVGGDFLTVYR